MYCVVFIVSLLHNALQCCGQNRKEHTAYINIIYYKPRYFVANSDVVEWRIYI